MTDDLRDEEPALPGKDPGLKKTQKSINLPGWIWDALEQISASTELPPEKPGEDPKREYSVNEVCEVFLKNRIAKWLDEQSGRRSHKKVRAIESERQVQDLRAGLAELRKPKK